MRPNATLDRLALSYSLQAQSWGPRVPIPMLASLDRYQGGGGHRTHDRFGARPPGWTPDVMDVFALRDNLIHEYGEYVSSFINVRDDRIRQKVDSWFDQGRLWPDPMVGLNPTFATGADHRRASCHGTLHARAARSSALGSPNPTPPGG